MVRAKEFGQLRQSLFTQIDGFCGSPRSARTFARLTAQISAGCECAPRDRLSASWISVRRVRAISDSPSLRLMMLRLRALANV